MSLLDQYPNYRPSRSLGRRRAKPAAAETQYVEELRRNTESPSMLGMFQAVFRKDRSTGHDPDAGLMGLLYSSFAFRHGARVIFSAWADRGNHVPQRDGSWLVITDHPVYFVAKDRAWKYAGGHFRDTLSALPSLSTADAGLLVEVTDYDHVLRWSGSAFEWGTGNPSPSGIYGLFETAPTTAGWQICDGSTVARLNADGTTTNVAVPDVTTARYLKGGLTAAAVAAASGNTANTTATNNSATTGVTVDAHPVIERLDDAGAGIWVLDAQADAQHTVNDPGHNHTQNAHNHGPGSLELASKQGILYYRR